jgi:hypothetical protein
MTKPRQTPVERSRVGDQVVPTPGVDLESPDSSTAPPMPHERDEAVGATGGVQSEQVQQAHRDLQRGLQDTSRAPEAERAYKKQKR